MAAAAKLPRRGWRRKFSIWLLFNLRSKDLPWEENRGRRKRTLEFLGSHSWHFKSPCFTPQRCFLKCFSSSEFQKAKRKTEPQEGSVEPLHIPTSMFFTHCRPPFILACLHKQTNPISNKRGGVLLVCCFVTLI